MRTPLPSIALVLALGAGACTKADGTASPSPNPIVATAQAATVAAPAPAAPAATTRFVGRFEKTDAGPRFAWSGSSVVAKFQGTTIAVKLKDDGPGKNVWYAIVDGEPKAMFKTTADKDTYTLAENLADGVHEVRLYKRTEARYGEATFLGFTTPGKLLAAPPAPERRIEVIGDSITTGYGNEGPGPTCLPTTEQQNHYVTYAALLARDVNADLHTIAWSGKTIHEMTQLYDRALPDKAESQWNFASWVPQVVVLNIGTNNFALADPGEERFVRLYTALVQRIRKAYPDALVVCALGPMLSDVYPEGHHNLTQARKYMKTAVGKLREKDAKIELLEFPEQKHADGLGCGFHPSPKTHKLMAERLRALVKEKLGW